MNILNKKQLFPMIVSMASVNILDNPNENFSYTVHIKGIPDLNNDTQISNYNGLIKLKNELLERIINKEKELIN